MRNLLSVLALAATVTFASETSAQVTAEILFDQEQFLRSESLPLRLRISNFSGQTLRMGDEADWLTFSIQGHEGLALARTGEIPLPKPFTLESSKTVSLKMDLMPYFRIGEPGHYSVTAKIRLPQLQRELTTEVKTFDIVSGVTLWEREVGIPGATPPVLRKFALQQSTFLKQQRLYVRLTDPEESKVFGVLPLGMLTSFSQPETAVDHSSQLHVLFQTGARSFIYSVVTPDGEHIIRQTWDYAGESRPRLRTADDGRVIVSGGARRILLSDLPPPRVANTNDKSESK